eukprot:32953-Pelagomonas_calceolata.AAC.2
MDTEVSAPPPFNLPSIVPASAFCQSATEWCHHLHHLVTLESTHSSLNGPPCTHAHVLANNNFALYTP